MLHHRTLAHLDWFVVSGDAETAYAELGRACAPRIRAVVESAAVMAPLRQRAEWSPHLPHVLEASRNTPAHAELVALAAGAGIPTADLELLNLRGDLGTDGLGCTDVALCRPDGLVVAHNEDGPADFDCVAVTLDIDGRAPIWAFWTPGMIPANSFVITGHGLAHGCDAITVTTPAAAPGRHFVARGLADATTLDDARAHLRSTPSAGGFHYALTDWRRGAYAGVEAAAGQFAELADDPVAWHTNHLRAIDGLDAPAENSLVRGRTAATWELPDGDPVAWCLDQLGRRPMPEGVYRGPETLGTMVLDCRAEPALTLQAGGQPPETIRVEDLLNP
ncbi:C45 family autoproteolytic acyltransferase/hydolase [Mariniluteicoccus flavus]